METIAKSKAERRLSTTRESELLHSFVRINIDEDTVQEDESNEQVEDEKAGGEKKDENRIRQAPLSAETSRRLSKEISSEVIKKKGKKKRKKGVRHEEIYCDKDRAAAVNMGSKDIKQSLKLKRKQDRSKMLQIPEEAEPSTFLALGNYEMCRGDLKIAIDFISKALELNPAEKNSLVARSKCYILLGQPEKALNDAETALQIDKSFIKAIYQKAEALYYLGDFEHSLMFYHRGLHIRPDHEGFKLGVNKSQKAIENAIGSFDKNLKIKIEKESTHSSSSSKQTPLQSQMTTTHPQKATTKRRAKSSSRLLRQLGPDKDYLDNLLNNPSIKLKFKGNDDSLEKCIKETVDYLNTRQEFWRQQLPPHLK